MPDDLLLRHLLASSKQAQPRGRAPWGLAAAGFSLAHPFGIELRAVRSGTRLSFGSGDPTLSEWMAEHPFVMWIEHLQPWLLEDRPDHARPRR